MSILSKFPCGFLIYFKYASDENYHAESINVNVLKVFKNSKSVKVLNFLMFPVIFPLFTVRFNFFRLSYIKNVIRNKRYSLIVFDFNQTFLYAKFIKGITKLFYCDDVIAQRYSRVYHGAFAPFVRLSEKYVLNTENVKIFCPSEKDKLLLSDLYNADAQITSVFIDKFAIQSYPVTVDNYFVFFRELEKNG